MMKKLAIVAACIAPFPSPASADRVQPPAATPGPIIVHGRARVDSRLPDQMSPATRAAYRPIFTLLKGNHLTAAVPAPDKNPSTELPPGPRWADILPAAGPNSASACPGAGG